MLAICQPLTDTTCPGHVLRNGKDTASLTTGRVRLSAEYGRPCVLPPRRRGARAHREEIRVREVDEFACRPGQSTRRASAPGQLIN